MISNRGKDWMEFAAKVLDHIEDYTVPQYGDSPDDLMHTEWEIIDCIHAMRKYLVRFDKQQRKGEEKLDMLKIAHFAQLAHLKMEAMYGKMESN